MNLKKRKKKEKTNEEVCNKVYSNFSTNYLCYFNFKNST